MKQQEIEQLFQRLNFQINSEQLEKLEKYYHLLISWSKKMNLTTILNEIDIYQKHFFDSLLLSNKANLSNQKFCDLGTGAGFPGVVIKIFFPRIKLYLIEPSQKRVTFLRELIKTLELNEVEIINERAENISKQYWEFFDIITARAVAKLNILLELAIPMLKVSGIFIALKANIDNELILCDNALKVLSTKIITIYESNYSFLGQRNIIYFEKLKSSCDKYPRNYSQIIKKPL